MADEVSRLRHAIRGCINAMKLGLSAMDLGLEKHEMLEFLQYMENSSVEMIKLLDEYDPLVPAVQDE